jgi:hypothetical protein
VFWKLALSLDRIQVFQSVAVSDEKALLLSPFKQLVLDIGKQLSELVVVDHALGALDLAYRGASAERISEFNVPFALVSARFWNGEAQKGEGLPHNRLQHCLARSKQ